MVPGTCIVNVPVASGAQRNWWKPVVTAAVWESSAGEFVCQDVVTVPGVEAERRGGAIVDRDCGDGPVDRQQPPQRFPAVGILFIPAMEVWMILLRCWFGGQSVNQQIELFLFPAVGFGS